MILADLNSDTYDTLYKKVTFKVFASLFLWIKLLYYMRTNKKLGYLIRMIQEVFKDIVAFLFLFIIFLISLSNAVYAIQEINIEREVDTIQSAFLNSYLIALGMYEFNGYEDPYSYFLFLVATILNLIVMLNLLIAIISDTYTRVASTADESSFKEKCGVISDCRDFPLQRLWMTQRKPCSFLFIAISEDIGVNKRKNIDVFDLFDELLKMKTQLGDISSQVDNIHDNGDMSAYYDSDGDNKQGTQMPAAQSSTKNKKKTKNPKDLDVRTLSI